MKHKLVIFDLDGTLLNTIGDLANACNHMLALRNLSPYSYEEYCTFVGNGIRRLVERALPEEYKSDDLLNAARADFVEYYTAHIDEQTHPYDGMISLVATLQERGYKLAVASNKFQAGTEKLIGKFFPDTPFVDVCGNREGVPLKPDTALVDIILQKAGIPLEDCIMVGDSAVDIETAHNAGIHSIGVKWGFRSLEELQGANAEYIVDSAEELLSVIESI